MNRIGRKIATLVSIDANKCGHHLRGTVERRAQRTLSLLQIADHVALHDQGGIDHDARRERETGERHDVERAAEHVQRDDGEEERERDRQADHGQGARTTQEIPESADRQQDADGEALLDEADRPPHVDAGVPGQLDEQVVSSSGPALSSSIACLMPSTSSTVFDSDVRWTVM